MTTDLNILCSRSLLLMTLLHQILPKNVKKIYRLHSIQRPLIMQNFIAFCLLVFLRIVDNKMVSSTLAFKGEITE